LINDIKKRSKGKKYDCILGVSGGVDSTYLAILSKQWGLNPLLVHFDNGWNSELAVENINKIIKYTKFDIYTYVVDWEEYKDLQRSFIKADVIDLESIMDIGFVNALQLINKKYNIGFVIDGQNIVTEGLLPNSWIHKTQENLINIHKLFGQKRLKTYPLINVLNQYRFKYFNRLKYVSPLNYIEYNKDEVKKIITSEIGWVDYGGKHYESVFTRFYQGYILPEKFKVDKRKAHLSNLIFSGQLTKEQATNELEKPIYPQELFNKDYSFVLKKLEFSDLEFKDYLNRQMISHEQYGSFISVWEKYKFLKILKPLNFMLKKILE
jgi:N-acetyl sugar amidotransferase